MRKEIIIQGIFQLSLICIYVGCHGEEKQQPHPNQIRINSTYSAATRFTDA